MIAGDQRDALRALLADATGLEVLDHVPEELLPPVLVLTPAEGYLELADTFGGWLVNLELYVLVELVGNAQAAEDLDATLAKVLGVVDGSLWSLNGMTKPGPFHSAAWLAHGIRLDLSTETTL